MKVRHAFQDMMMPALKAVFHDGYRKELLALGGWGVPIKPKKRWGFDMFGKHWKTEAEFYKGLHERLEAKYSNLTRQLMEYCQGHARYVHGYSDIPRQVNEKIVSLEGQLTNLKDTIKQYDKYALQFRDPRLDPPDSEEILEAMGNKIKEQQAKIEDTRERLCGYIKADVERAEAKEKEKMRIDEIRALLQEGLVPSDKKKQLEEEVYKYYSEELEL